MTRAQWVRQRWARLCMGLACLLMAPSASAHSPSEEQLWHALRSGGHAVLMRHALAPGGGDPPGWTLANCASQRNLSAAGVRQAQRSGALFRQNGLRDLPVYTSQWCRARETAQAMALGSITEHPGLNSFFQRPEHRERILESLQQLVGQLASGPSVLMVSHQVTVRAISGVALESGGMLVVELHKDGSVRPIGRLPTASTE